MEHVPFISGCEYVVLDNESFVRLTYMIWAGESLKPRGTPNEEDYLGRTYHQV